MTGLEQQLAELMTMPHAQLRSLWRDTYRSSAPEIGPDLLRRGIANRLRNAYPDFDQRSYGHAKLADLIRATGRFEVQTASGGAMKVRDRA